MNFAQFISILNARKKLMMSIFFTVVLSTLVITLLLPKTYKATTAVLVNYKGVDPLTGYTIPAQLMPGYMATQAKIIESLTVAEKVVELLNFDQNPSTINEFQASEDSKKGMKIKTWIAAQLVKNLEVEPSKETSMIEISYKHTEPKLAELFANAFAKAYQIVGVQLKVEPSKVAAELLEKEVEARRVSLETAQAKLSKYQQEKGLTSVMGNLDVESARLNDLSYQLVAVQSQAYDAISRENNSKGNGDASPDIASNPIVQNIKIQISQAESGLSEIAALKGKNHPQYESAKAQLDQLHKELQAELVKAGSSIGGTSRIYQQKEGEIREALEAQKKKVLDLNLARDQQTVLTSDVTNAQRAMELASQRYSQTSLEGNANQADVAVLNPANLPLVPDSPKTILNMIIAIMLGGILSLIGAFVAESLNRKVRTQYDLHDLFGVPVLTIVKDRDVKHVEKNPFLNIFQRIRPD